MKTDYEKYNTIIWDITPFSPAEFFACRLFLDDFLLGLLFAPEDGDNTFLRNLDGLLPEHTALHPS
jgi:hypothetical protein